MLKSVSDVVQAFGGIQATARFIGITPQGVTNAIRRNSLPVTWHARIMLEARRRRKRIDPSLFGIVQPKEK